MDGEVQEAQGPQDGRQAQGQVQQQQDAGRQQVGGSAQAGYDAAIAERDRQIAELQAQVAQAAKSEESAAELTKQIEDLKAKAESDRLDYELRLAGARSTVAARALLSEHGGDVAALKEAEPWLFTTQGGSPAGGKTGLEPKGAATSSDKDMKRWRRLAGLDEE